MYPQEIEKLIRLVLLFAKGFAFQKGSLFGFGPHADDHKKVVKIHKANSEILENLDKNAGVQNIGEERRNLGSFNYASTVSDSGKFWNLYLAMLR